MKMNSGAERRRHPRVSRSYTMRVKERDAQDPLWELPMMRNISVGGCYFHSTVNYQEGQCLEIEIQLPVLREPLRCTGLVRRIEPRREGMMDYVGVGLEFMDMQEDVKQKLKEVVDFTLARQQKEGH